MDIKNTLEAFAAVEAEADAVLKSCADGELTVLDVRFQLPVLSKARAAFQDAMLIPAELKELDDVEAEQIFATVLRVGDKVVAAFEAVMAIVAKDKPL